MILTEHRVQNYRNIVSAQFSPDPALTVICGANGQGKTNLLESIWLVCGAKSFRQSKDQDLVQKGEEFALIESTAQDKTGEKLEFRIAIGGENASKHGRYAKLNGMEMGRATNLAGHFFAVVFAPGHLSLVKGSPEERRRFLDAALCQLYPRYRELYRRYLHSLRQKNALLKDAGHFGGVWQLLDSFDQQLAQAGSELCCFRYQYLQGLFEIAQNTYAGISSQSESCRFLYIPTADSADAMMQKLFDSRSADLKAGFCTVGPHREDIQIEIGGTQARSFASQGQQRSAVLSLKLAEAAMIERITGASPAILLDDVLSELDKDRQAFLLGNIEGRQVFLTSCDETLVAGKAGSVYRMEKGCLFPA